MKKILALVLCFSVIVSVFSVGTLSANAAVGDYTMYEVEGNNSMATADRIYDNYTVSGYVSGSDLDFFKFTLSQTSRVTFLAVADYSILLCGIWDSSEDCVAAAVQDGYTSSGNASFIISTTLSAGTYYLILFNDSDYSSRYNPYTFYIELTSQTSTHTHSYSSSVTAPTCNAQGYTTYTCSCGDSYVGNYTNPAHSMGIWVTTEEATCEKAGEKRRNCSNLECDYYETQVIPVSHDMGRWVTIPATCFENGETYRVCSKCSHTESKIIPASHTLVTLPAKAPTYTSTGLTAGKKCSVCGTITVAQKVVAKLAPISLKSAKFTVNAKTYTGKAITQSITVKLGTKTLRANIDYTISYKNNKNIGKATVTITGKGAYKDSVSKTFAINPKSVSGLKLKAGKKQIKASWKKNTKAGGYEIQYSTSSKFSKKSTKTVKIASYKTSSKTIKKLGTKKYYIRIRAFKKVSGTTYYSDWSSAKSMYTKHTHKYSKATCTKAKTCKICGATSGKSLGHKKGSVKCSRCGKVLFTKLTYSGRGIDKIKNINIPKGDYVLKLVATGTHDDVIDNCFVYLYNGGETYYTSAYAGVTVSVPIYGWSSSENDPFEGPIKKGTIKVDAPDDIKWTITITPY